MSNSDETFLKRQDQLNKQNWGVDQEENFFNQGILKAFFSHPLAQLVYLIQEGMKMFFWETSQGAFVAYPSWLENLFNNHGIVILMSLGSGFFCLIGFLIACSLLKNELILITVVLTGLLILLFGFVNVLHRYAIVAAPLMILINASCLSILTTKAAGFFVSKDR